jgi:hypothetical protein
MGGMRQLECLNRGCSHTVCLCVIGNLYPAELVWLIQSIAIQSMQPAVQSRLLRLNVDCNTTVAVTETVASFPDGRNVLLGLWILSLTVNITMCQA